MAFDPDEYLAKEEPKNSISKITDLVSKATDITYPLTNPVTNAIRDAANTVGKSVDSITGLSQMGSKIAENPNLLKDSPNLKAVLATGVDMAAGGIPYSFDPTAVSIALGLQLAPSISAPKLGDFPVSKLTAPFDNPAVIDSGIKSALGKLSDPALTPQSIAQAAQESYLKRVSDPLAELTKPRIVPEPYQQKTGPEILAPKYQEVSNQINPEQITMKKVGDTIQGKYSENVSNLRSIEKNAWDNLSTEHFSKPANLENTKNYITSVFKEQGTNIEPSYLDRLNPNLKAAAMQSNNPEAAAKALANVGAQTKNPMNYLTEPPLNEVASVPNLSSKLSVLNKIYEISNESNLNFGQIKKLRTQIGAMLDESPRGDSNNYVLKQVYKNISEDMANASKEGGFQNEAQSAINATKDYFKYTDNPSSRIIEKTKYSSDLLNRLIKSDSPERVTDLYDTHKLSDSDKNIVQRGILDKISEKAAGDPKKFSRILDSYSSDTRKAIFGNKFDLVESIKDTAKTLDEEIFKSKMKLPAQKSYAPEDVLSQTGLDLDKIMKKSNGSELLSNILKDGTPEMARTVSGALGENSMSLMRRGVINDIIENSKTKLPNGDYRLNLNDLNKNLQKINPDFINEFFGKDGKKVNAIRDVAKFYKEEINADSRVGNTPFGFQTLRHIWNIAKEYRLPAQVSNIIENTAGSKFATEVIPKKPLGVPFLKAK